MRKPAGSRPVSGPALIECRSDDGLVGGILIEADEFAKIYREWGVFIFAEWVSTERAFKAADNDGEAERVEARVEQRELVFEGRKTLILFLRNELELL
jgi:hypothetical protein